VNFPLISRSHPKRVMVHSSKKKDD